MKTWTTKQKERCASSSHTDVLQKKIRENTHWKKNNSCPIRAEMREGLTKRQFFV